jgi:hypothetical protein
VRHRRVAAPLVAGLALTLVVVSQGVALLQWGTIKPLSNDFGALMWSGGLGASGSNVHVAYRRTDEDNRHVAYRRSTDGGRTWNAPIELSDEQVVTSSRPSLAVYGAMVHVVYSEAGVTSISDDYADAFDWAKIVYRRSVSAGATWEARQDLTGLQDDSGNDVNGGFPSVSAAGQSVYVAWSDRGTGGIFFRRSTDRGVTWKPSARLGSTTQDYTGDNQYDGRPALAVGDGVVYLVWMGSRSAIKLRRSLDGGATWAPAITLETHARGSKTVRIAASGRAALVVFMYDDGQGPSYTATVATSDAGATWTTRAKVSTGTTPALSGDVIFKAAKWRIAYLQCGDDSCSWTDVWYRDSLDRKTWSRPAVINSTSADAPTYMGEPSLAHAPSTRTTVVGWGAGEEWPDHHLPWNETDSDIYARAGQVVPPQVAPPPTTGAPGAGDGTLTPPATTSLPERVSAGESGPATLIVAAVLTVLAVAVTLASPRSRRRD